MLTACGRPQGGSVHVDRGRGFFVDVINGWSLVCCSWQGIDRSLVASARTVQISWYNYIILMLPLWLPGPMFHLGQWFLTFSREPNPKRNPWPLTEPLEFDQWFFKWEQKELYIFIHELLIVPTHCNKTTNYILLNVSFVVAFWKQFEKCLTLFWKEPLSCHVHSQAAPFLGFNLHQFWESLLTEIWCDKRCKDFKGSFSNVRISFHLVAPSVLLYLCTKDHLLNVVLLEFHKIFHIIMDHSH